jgi:hypothetical protein
MAISVEFCGPVRRQPAHPARKGHRVGAPHVELATELIVRRSTGPVRIGGSPHGRGQ